MLTKDELFVKLTCLFWQLDDKDWLAANYSYGSMRSAIRSEMRHGSDRRLNYPIDLPKNKIIKQIKKLRKEYEDFILPPKITPNYHHSFW